MKWTPIGNSANGFKGTFDGQNYTVSNYIVEGKTNVGLFGYALNGGNIKNLKVKNATVKADDYAGAILGRGYTDIVNCHVEDSTVTVTPYLLANGEYDGGAKAGAVVGQLLEGAGNTLVNCSAKNVKVSGYRDIGAVLGMAHNNNTVTDCKAYDSVVAYLILEDGQVYAEGKVNENIGEVVGRVQSSATVTDSYYENVTLKKGDSTSMGNSDGNVDVPDSVELPDGIEFSMTDPVVDEANKKVTIAEMCFKDANGNEVDLSDNTEPITVTIEVPFADGEIFEIEHDGEYVATAVVTDGKLVYECLHFCKVDIAAADLTPVATADELIKALEAGESVLFTKDIKIDPANMSNAYGTTGINVTKGQTIDGNGYTLNIKGAGGTWDSGINTTGGIIRNITITGSFRGIFVNHTSTYSETVVLHNVITDGTVYTISCDQGMNQNLEAYNCTFNGWTSFAATLGKAKFVDCTFSEGSGYAYCRPYAPTEFIGCEFEADFEMDPCAAVTLENCTLDGVAITADNLGTLVTSNIANATVK